jgi:hypothetical protein
MATIDDERAKLIASLARAMKEDARRARELLWCGRIDEAAELVNSNFRVAQAIWCEMSYLTRPPPPIPIRGKSRGR